jgi:hypothetical protein
MHRVLGLLIFASVALGVYLLTAGPDAGPTGMGPDALRGYGGWAAGLFMGLLLAWLVGIDWRTLPQRMVTWVKLQRHRLGWALIAGVCVGILLLL